MFGERYMVLSFLGKSGKSGASTGGPEGPRFQMLAEVRAYWEGLRQGGALPAREAIDPRGISGALENTFLLERIAPGIARFRIAGMNIHDLMGMDVRGMPLSALCDPSARSRLSDALEGVFQGPATLELWLEAERSIGRPPLEGRMLILPVTGHRGESELALGCLALEGGIGRAPRRFSIAGLMSEIIERRAQTERRQTPREGLERRLSEFSASQAAEKAPETGFAEAQRGFDAERPPRAPAGRSHLRLVHSKD